ncbi:MAG: hypothetical protein OHK93_001842 [Ramalina farinacea]|uniref:Uncharacterized protein n=1 Tax=Ramalina farinacea TaxID=258253 RepID=A0AA43TWM5_9LECA|nr:hypothetical protein [Ramalina farinacea]
MGTRSSPDESSQDAMFPKAGAEQSSGAVASSSSFPIEPSSPPASQTQASQNDGLEELMDAAEEEGASVAQERMGRDTFVPGASWNNKKARDEWQRAWNQLEHKSFSLKEFGDPFDDSLNER